MIELSLAEVAAATGGRVHGDPQGRVAAVTTDSRTVPAGRALFVALRGEHVDGHDFASAAAAVGAVAVLAERVPAGVGVPVVEVEDSWHALAALAGEVRRRVDTTAVAITGSVGKTTVKDLAAAALRTERRVLAATGSQNNEVGVPLTLLGLTGDVEVLVTEIGARHEGDIARLAPLVAPDVAVVTAVASVHLEIFGSIDAIARAKGELVEALRPGGLAVLNVADPRVAAMADRAPSVLRVGTDVADADVRAERVALDRRARARADVTTPWGRVEVGLRVAGRHQVSNALLALGVAGHLGVDLEAAARGIEAAEVSPWRGEVVEADGIVVINDAYNASPLAVRAALETLGAVERTGATWAVLGLMAEIGPTSTAEHLGVGRRCAELGVGNLVTVGETAGAIAAGAIEGGLPADRVISVRDAEAALDLLTAQVAPGDVVLVKASRVAGLETVAAGLVAVQGARSADAETGS